MPRIKRWFPVSHDFFDDPEVVELVNLFGERSVFMWMRMLSWGDRSDGYLAATKAQVSAGLRQGQTASIYVTM